MERDQGAMEKNILYGHGCFEEEGGADHCSGQLDPGYRGHDRSGKNDQDGERQLRRHVEDPPGVPGVTLIEVSGNFAISYALNLNT